MGFPWWFFSAPTRRVEGVTDELFHPFGAPDCLIGFWSRGSASRHPGLSSYGPSDLGVSSNFAILGAWVYVLWTSRGATLRHPGLSSYGPSDLGVSSNFAMTRGLVLCALDLAGG
jgi:hypothetical protein